MKRKLLITNMFLGIAIASCSLVSCNNEPSKEEPKTVLSQLKTLKDNKDYLIISNGNIRTRKFENKIGYSKDVYSFNDQIYVDQDIAGELTSGFVNVDNQTVFYTYDSTDEEYVIDGIYDTENTYDKYVFSFSDFILDDESFNERANKDRFIFNLRRTSSGDYESKTDGQNAYYLTEMIRLGSVSDYLIDLDVSVTDDGLDFSLVLEGQKNGIPPLLGQITVSVIIGGSKAVHHDEILKKAQETTLKVLEPSDDMKELIDMVNNETYQIHIPGDEEHEQPETTFYFSKKYFAVSIGDMKLIHKVNDKNKVEIYATNENNGELEYLKEESKLLEEVDEDPFIVLNVISKQLCGMTHLSLFPEFQKPAVFSSKYGPIDAEGHEGETVLNGILIDDLFNMTGLNDEFDKLTGWNTMAPFKLAGSFIEWQNKETETHEDDLLRFYILLLDVGAMGKYDEIVTFTKFGVEFEGIDSLTPEM